MFRTPDTPGAVVEKEGNTSKADMSPSPISQFVLGLNLFATDAARQLPFLLGLQLDLKLIAYKRGGDNPMAPEPESRTILEISMSLFSIVWASANPLNSKLDSCFQAFSSSVTAQILVTSQLSLDCTLLPCEPLPYFVTVYQGISRRKAIMN